MIVDRIEEYLSGEGEDIADAALETMSSLVERSVRRNFGKRRESTPRRMSPSSAWSCGRRLLFDASPVDVVPREPLSTRARTIFAMGDMLEAAALLLARQAGVELLYPHPDGTQLRLEAEVEGGMMAGYVDAVIEGPSGPVIVDVKSMSSYSFDKAKAAATDPSAVWWEDERDGIVAQLRWYLLLARQTLYGNAREALVLGVKKDTGHLCEIRVEWCPHEEARLLNKLAYMRPRFAEYEAALAENPAQDPTPFLPPHPSWAKAVERTRVRLPDGSTGRCMEIQTDRPKDHRGSFQGWRCSYCPFIEACWPGFQVVPMAKPVYRMPLDIHKGDN